MSQRNSYLEAAVPEPFTVLGRKLLPFSVGHQILLEKFGSSYALGYTEAPGYSDLILSVFICSHTFEENLKQLKSRHLSLRLKLWGWYCGKFDVIEAMLFFRKYLDAHTNWPKRFWIERGTGGSSSGSPFIQSLKVRLQKDLGYSEAEALNAPYQMALWNYLTNLENQGVIRLFSDRDEAMLEASQNDELARQVEAIGRAVRRKEHLN